MEAAIKAGRRVRGVELSDVSQTTCRELHRQGLVQQGPLHKIPFPNSTFDLVFTSEVLEHVPPALAEASVRELVRVARRDVFATISLRPSALDRPGRPPKVHLCVRTRDWWERLFERAGCARNEDAFRRFQQYDKAGRPISPHFFIYTCKGPTD
uniref:Methyltransferase type 11 domain-containing protein n=1 Tax=Tetraselmis sp. GSL018 TaxID=582737 RepID=A0A061S1W0_9CHLO|mmetsp:Transcript_37052/g.88072  ORF Transcript_37052/g.88072 Transcript_37052/m.88072 type:complete len:154 (+) Transcript_37052:956-1417(+)